MTYKMTTPRYFGGLHYQFVFHMDGEKEVDAEMFTGATATEAHDRALTYVLERSNI